VQSWLVHVVRGGLGLRSYSQESTLGAHTTTQIPTTITLVMTALRRHTTEVCHSTGTLDTADLPSTP